MNTNKNTYHIDVTEEEDAMFREPEVPEQENKSSAISFKTAFIVALIVHVAGAFALFSTPQKASAKDVGTELSKATQAQTETPPAPSPTPNPTPLTANNSKPNEPQKQPQKNVVNNVSQKNMTREYVVKRGDSFYSIVKRYKLNFEQLKKINNIEDPSKIQVGQKLKFM